MEYLNAHLGNPQSNVGNSRVLVIRNTTRMLIVVVLAGMMAMAATFGSALKNLSKSCFVIARLFDTGR